MPANIAKDYKEFENDRDARIELISSHPHWYLEYLKATTDPLTEPEPEPVTVQPNEMIEYIDGFLLPTLHKLKRENKLVPN